MTLDMIMIRQNVPLSNRSRREILSLHESRLRCKNTGEERGAQKTNCFSPSALQQEVVVRLVRNHGFLQLLRMAAT